MIVMHSATTTMLRLKQIDLYCNEDIFQFKIQLWWGTYKNDIFQQKYFHYEQHNSIFQFFFYCL